MNLLIVDDQKEIVESLKKGIRWDRLPVGQVYTAVSAREAKLVLVNFAVDVLITDIEMPEENGLELARWARENVEDLEIVFLTSHPDFRYAQGAIRLGSFDYILQPVRYEDVERVILRAEGTVEKKRKLRRLEDTRGLVAGQRNTILDAMLAKALGGKEEDAGIVFRHFVEMFQVEYETFHIMPILVQIQRWKKITDVWDENLVRMVLANVIEELLEEKRASAAVSCIRDMRYWIFLTLPDELPSVDWIAQRLMECYTFINKNMDFQVSVYCCKQVLAAESTNGAGSTGMGRNLEGQEGFRQLPASEVAALITQLNARSAQNTEKKLGVFWEDFDGTQDRPEDDFVSEAMEYVKRNINKNIMRADVAELVHLNEEYFSRVFKAKTGVTFKDYVLYEKMKTAQFLLANTKLSVGIVASKVGYDNFSHFTKMFKKLTNRTPQEYRKDNQG